MQKERWQEINRIFHAALDLPPDDRPSFVSTAAPNDPDLQSEVERLLAADLKAESYLESPLIPTGALNPAFADAPQLPPGHVLCERFHILRTVGSGGMGQVFEAYDSELGVNVALKLIRPEIAANPQARARFRQEVRLARRITHPNVCRTYDVDRDTLPNPSGPHHSLVFLTMEFLPGETLAERLKRTPPLTLEEILAIARQIAAALDAAHALGIIHRDIKPGNIMLVPPGENSRQAARVVITDFGLARLDPNAAPFFHGAEHSITNHSSQANQPIGTLAYMAPEQMDGRPVSAATDIYAFGLLLFEMATGQRAFPSSNLLSGIAQRLTGPAPSPRTLNADLPESIERAIQGCLQRNPQDRFPTAQAVLDCLTGLAPSGQPEPPTIQPQTEPAKPQLTPKPRLTPRLTLIAATILPLAVSLFLLGDRYSWWRGNPAVPPGALVYLAPVKNETGEKSLDNITELLRASLEQSARINLLDQGKAGDILQNMTKPADTPITEPIGREIALRAAAARVIFATVTGSQGHYKLEIDIQRPEYSNPLKFRDHWTNSYTWQVTGSTNNAVLPATIPQELTSTLQTATDWIRKEAGESQDDITRLDTPPEDVTTDNWEALGAYRIAHKFLAAGKKEEAVSSLKEATRIDPAFASAFADLGDNLVSMGRLQEGYSAYLSALNEVSGHRLSRKERDFIKGTFAADTHDYQVALEAFRDYSAFFENDFNGWFYQSVPLDMLDRPQDALKALQRADMLSYGNHHPAAGQFVYNYLLLGNFSAAHRWIQSLRDDGNNDLATYLDGITYFLEAQYDLSQNSFAQLKRSGSFNYRNLGYALTARLLAEQGRFADARATITEGMSVMTSSASPDIQGVWWLDLAYIDLDSQRFTLSIDEVAHGISLNSSPDAILWASTIVGSALPRLSGDGKRFARDLLHRMDSSLSNDDLGLVYALAHARVRGELALAGADSTSALVSFRKADALDAPLTPREYLARGLLAAANSERSAPQAAKLRAEALQAYAKTAARPAAVWRRAWDYPPGFVSDQMLSYIKVAKQLSRKDAQVRQVEAAWTDLRHHPLASTSSPAPTRN